MKISRSEKMKEIERSKEIAEKLTEEVSPT
jgi:hypothetical protein